MVDKIINNCYDAVDYGQEALSQSPIAINPLVSDQYEEAISENIEDIYTRKNLYNQMSELYEASEFYEKYGDVLNTQDGLQKAFEWYAREFQKRIIAV